MRKKQIAVCDREPAYTLRFAEYANRRRDALFLVHGFGSFEELEAYLGTHTVDVLLLAASFAERLPRAPRAGQVILLVEKDYLGEKDLLGEKDYLGGKNCLEKRDCLGEAQGYPVILKLQSAKAILRQTLDLYAQTAPAGLGLALKPGKMKRIGIYSPVGRTGKTSFALALGQRLTLRKKTLYLNLEEYSGFETLYPYGDGWTLSELMYFLKQGKNAFACKLESMIQEIGGLDYIPPLKSPVELRHVSLENWECLLEALEKESRYQLVILDLGGAVNGLYELLESCDVIYTPVSQDFTAQAKLAQYENTLQLLELEEILEKTVQLPVFSEGEMDCFVREEEKRWLT